MKNPEQQGMRISLVGALFFAILGISFAVWSESQAVLLDGAFNLITAVMVLFAMRITRLLQTPESEKRPAGYVALEPLYILGKGLILLVLTLFVMASNVIILFSGGNELKLGAITIYIGIAVIGNFIIWYMIHTRQKGAPSPLLEVEKQNWLVNTLISTGIGVSFFLVFLFQDGALKSIVPYVDQVVVILVGLISLPVPINAIRAGLKELLLMGADDPVQEKAREIVRSGLDKSEVKDWKLYVLKTGRKYWFSLFINPAEESIDADMGDKIREMLTPELLKEFSQCNMDVIFTRVDELKI
jgi:predicted Co/Zn/Cd cation transporter (cation efflux family)